MVLLLSNFESCYCFINWTDWFHKQQIWQNYDRFSCLKLFTGYKWHFWSLINKVGIIVYQYNVKWFLLYEENLSRNANEVQFYCHTKWRAQVAIYFGETNYRCRSPILKIAPTESVASLYANICYNLFMIQDWNGDKYRTSRVTGRVEQNKGRFKIDTETISQQRKIKPLSTLR